MVPSDIDDVPSDIDDVRSDIDGVPGPQKESGESDEGEQLTILVEAKVRDLFHIACNSAGVNHYSALESQRQVLVRLKTFLTSYSYYFGEYKNLISLSTHTHLSSLEKGPSAHNLDQKFRWMTPCIRRL